jgi:hypothetical protein
MHSRPEVFVVAVLAVLTLGVTSTSATLALRATGATTASGPAASLPPVLFSPEPPAPVSPVRADLSGPKDDGVGLASPPAEVATSQTRVKPAASPPRVRLTLAYAQRRVQGRAIITYTATVKNEAPMPLQGLTLSSHVPSGTVWRAAAPCRGDARPLSLGYGDESKVAVCVPAPKAEEADNHEAHEMVAVFDRPVPPGGTISASWTVEVRGSGKVVNHVHLAGPGIDGQSPPATVETT